MQQGQRAAVEPEDPSESQRSEEGERRQLSSSAYIRRAAMKRAGWTLETGSPYRTPGRVGAGHLPLKHRDLLKWGRWLHIL